MYYRKHFATSLSQLDTIITYVYDKFRTVFCNTCNIEHLHVKGFRTSIQVLEQFCKPRLGLTCLHNTFENRIVESLHPYQIYMVISTSIKA